MQCSVYDREHLDTKLLELPCFAGGEMERTVTNMGFCFQLSFI